MHPFVARGIPACVALMLTGCATGIDMAKVEPEKIYRTGSNIAERDHALPSNVETKTVNTADPDRLGLPMAGKLPTGGGH
jgi:hypothetical protein